MSQRCTGEAAPFSLVERRGRCRFAPRPKRSPPSTSALEPSRNVFMHRQTTETTMPETLETASDQPLHGRGGNFQMDSPSRSTSRFRVRYNAALKIIRRVHMYVGLFLVPWVFLYGVSAFLFNHPGAFPDREVRTLDRSEIADMSLDAVSDAPALAARIVDALNARAGDRSYRLGDPQNATFSRPLTATATERGREHAVRYDLDSGVATIRSTPTADPSPQGLPDGEVLRLEDPPRERMAHGIATWRCLSQGRDRGRHEEHNHPQFSGPCLRA